MGRFCRKKAIGIKLRQQVTHFLVWNRRQEVRPYGFPGRKVGKQIRRKWDSSKQGRPVAAKCEQGQEKECLR